jgi:hypothetical protein
MSLRSPAIRFVALVLSLALLTSAYYRIHSAAIMADAARHFLNSLDPQQAAKARIPFNDDERMNFHYVPIARRGLPLKEMTASQKQLANALLAAGLSQRGYIKATTIMSLEDVLRVIENDDGVRRNPEGYFFSIFGEPAEKGAWGYRVEGHHFSLNVTVVDGKVCESPNFLGANPAEVRSGPRQGLRALAAEEDLGRALISALDTSQRNAAIVAKEAYKDILTAQDRKAALQGQPSGLPYAKMNPRQRAMLAALMDEYAYNLPEPVAQARLDQIRQAGSNLYFAWAGGIERGQKHYYRVQAPTFLIEYDNTQNDANHIHSVWRDFAGDFGQDMLGRHLALSPHGR